MNIHPPTKKTIIPVIYSLFILLNSYSSAQTSTIVNTAQGPVQGVTENGIIVYKGIPFAEPPVGDLRWRPPQPPRKRDDIFIADHYAPACPQPVFPMISDLKYGTSEDCLYLNIWKPVNTQEEKLPVLVWIHGGGFTIGTASQALLNGEKLAAKGIIVVSIAYRLGALGFIAHPELTSESEHKVSGNYGILDQIAALQWIQKNISAFAGDPECVTIFGESAGGQSVNILVASPLAKGLFHRAICMSGGYFGYATYKKEEESVQLLRGAEADGLEFVRRAGANSIQDLRKTEVSKITGAQGTGALGFSYWPVIDGYVITDDLYSLFSKGKYHDVPVLTGITSDEGTLFILNSKPVDYPLYLKTRFGDYSEKILELYPAGTTPDSIRRSAADLLRDSYFGWFTYTWADLLYKTGKSPAYVYYFDQTQPPSPATLLFKSNKPFHGSDLPYVFNHLDTDPNVKYTEGDRKLSETIVDYWVNFTRNGDPNGPGLPVWPSYNRMNPQAMQLKSIPQAVSYPNLDRLKLLDEYYQWKRKKILNLGEL